MIFYVEDDKNIRELVVYTLVQSGFEAAGFESGEELLDALKQARPELVMLDIMLPGDDGLELLKRLRAHAESADIPIMMVTAKDSEFDKVTGLDLGADDYIAKPFGMMELVARVRALLRRAAPGEKKILNIEGIELDTEAHTVAAHGEAVSLTFKEFELLRFLMESAGRAFDREKLLSTIWGFDYDGGTRTVDVHIQTLRRKLGECGQAIETVRGVGYKIGGKA